MTRSLYSLQRQRRRRWRSAAGLIATSCVVCVAQAVWSLCVGCIWGSSINEGWRFATRGVLLLIPIVQCPFQYYVIEMRMPRSESFGASAFSYAFAVVQKWHNLLRNVLHPQLRACLYTTGVEQLYKQSMSKGLSDSWSIDNNNSQVDRGGCCWGGVLESSTLLPQHC